MSYAKFKDALNHFYGVESNRDVHYETAFERVRDDWIATGRLLDLTKAILANWDSGNCENYIRPLEDELFRLDNSELFVTLWIGILKHRVRGLSLDSTGTKRNYLIEGISQMREGLKRFSFTPTIAEEMLRLEAFVAAVLNKNKPRYPKST